MAKLLTGTRVYGTANVDNVMTVGNITPVNSTSNTTGSLIVVGGVGILGNTYTGNLVISGSSAAGNGITFADGTRQTTAATGGGGIDQYARDTANVIIGTDVGQNTRMTISDGVNVSQNVRIDYSNTAITIIQGVDLGQNTAIAATDGKMQSAFNKANTAATTSGYLANSVIFANTTGYLSNTSNISFYTSNNTLVINGTLAATSKSFSIPHPTKPNTQLRYGSLEGPENGVYIRGKLINNDTIELPEYWTKLVDKNTITVNLTPIGKHQNLYVQSVNDNVITVANGSWFNKDINCYFIVCAERNDIAKLVVEQ
jgi:hypothetical protein